MSHARRSRSPASLPFARSRWAVAAVLAGTSAAVAAPGDPIGAEFKIDTYNGVNYPAVGMDGAGHFVVAWQGFDGTSAGIVVRRYDAAGVAQGSGRTVSGSEPAFSPSIAQAPDGRYVVAYTSSSVADPGGIFLRRFAADGTGQTEVLVNTTTFGTQVNPAVAIDGDGDFVVAWTTFTLAYDSNVFAQRFSAAGTKLGGEFQVNAVADHAGNPSVGMDASGNFVVAYASENQDGDGSGIYAQRYDATGAAVGSEFRVNTTTTGGQMGPDVAMNDGGAFVVTWVSAPETIMAQRYDAAGAALGGELQVDVTAPGSDPVVAIDADGDFLVTWQSYGHDEPSEPFGPGIFARRYSAGTPGDEFVVNTTVSGGQTAPEVAMNADGAAVVAWQSNQANTNLDIFGQRFAGATAGPDTTPDAFHFTDQADVPRSTEVESDAITVAGIDAAADVTVTGGEYRVNGGAFGSAAGTVAAGDTVSVRHTSSAAYGTATDTVLTIGGVSDTFTSVTESAPLPDTTPDAFTFVDVTGAEPAESVESNDITVAGIDAPSPISISGGQYRVGDGAYTAVAGTVSAGQVVRVRAAAGDFGESVDAVLTIGGVSDTFSVATRDANHDVVDDANGDPVEFESSDGILTNLRKVDAPAFAPTGLTYANGFFGFDVEGVPVGGTVTVTITLPAGATPDRYVKCTASACAEFAGTSIAGNVVTLTLRDGGEGDADGAADGHIQDPGAPAKASSGGGGGGGGGGGAFDWMTLGLLALLGLSRRRHGSRRLGRETHTNPQV